MGKASFAKSILLRGIDKFHYTPIHDFKTAAEISTRLRFHKFKN